MRKKTALMYGAVIALLLPNQVAAQQPLCGATTEAELAAITPDSLVTCLGQVKGRFVQEANGFWGFHGDQRLFTAFYEKGDAAVKSLVQCIGRSDPSGSTAAGTPVPVGYMCFQALIRMVYSTEHEDGEGDWPGILLDPHPSLEQLRLAQSAWQEVVLSGKYRIAMGRSGRPAGFVVHL